MMNAEYLTKIFYCDLVVNYKRMSEGLFELLINFQLKTVALIDYWNTGDNYLPEDSMKVLNTINNILNELIGRVYTTFNINVDKNNDFVARMDYVTDNCKYAQILEDSGCLYDIYLPNDNGKDFKENVISTSVFFNHLHFIHYCEVVDKYYPHLISDSNTEDLFLSLAIMSDKYFNDMWTDINIGSIEIFKERGTIN